MRVRSNRPARSLRLAGLVPAVMALAATGLLPPTLGGSSAFAAVEPVVTTTPVADLLFNRTVAGGGEDRNISNQVVKLIRSATSGSTVRISAFRFNDAEVSGALVDAASARDVKVFVATNDLEAGSKWADIAPALRKAGGGITYCGHSCVHNGGINHDKFMLLSSVQYSGESAPRTHVVFDTSQNMSLGQANELNNAWVRYGDAALYAGFASRFASMYAQQVTLRLDVNSGVAADADGTRITVRFSPRFTAYDFVAADVRAVPCAKTSVIRITGSVFSNRPALRDALISKRKCGVEVSAVLRDAMSGEDDQGSYDELGAAGIPIAGSRPGGCRKPVYCGTGLVHSKLVLLEYTTGSRAHRIVYTGSHNWARGSLTSSDETSVRFRWQGPVSAVGTPATALYDTYVRYVDQLWDDARDIRPQLYGVDPAHYSDVDVDPASDEHSSVVAASRSGRSIVVWEQQAPDAPGQALTQIYARTYLRGAPEGPPCRLSAPGAGEAWSDVGASAGMDDAGNAVVAWREDSEGDGTGHISVVRVEPGAYTTCPPVTKLAPPQKADAPDQQAPSVAVNGRGDYAIAWQTDVNGHSDIRASTYRHADDGSFPVVPGLDGADVSDGTGASQHTAPAAGMSDDGTVSVVWAEDLDGDGSAHIELRRFGADGGSLGPPVLVSAHADRHQTRPDIAVNALGQAVVTWQELPSPTAPRSDSRVAVQRVDTDGKLHGSEAPAAACMPGAFSCGQDRPDVAIADNGTFVVAWREDEPWVRLAAAPDTRRVRSDVWARGFPWDAAQPHAAAVLPLYRMNLITANEQSQPSLAVQPDNRSLLLAYTDDFDSETGGTGAVALRANFTT